jgi:anti-sigma regulatory factor (Ser/Thr protein kinase)
MSAVDGQSLNECHPALASSVPRAREALTALAQRAGATAEQLDAVRLAASEALTNVVVHAYRGSPGAIHVSAAVTSGELWILIADDGCGLHPRSDRPGLGLGFALIAQASDDFVIVQRSGGGTELRMRFNLGVPGIPADGQSRASLSSADAPA